MTAPSGFAIAAAVMFATGIGIPVMAALNAELGRGIGSPPAATALLFAVGLGFALLYLAGVSVTAGAPDWSRLAAVPRPACFAAVFMVFYIAAITTLAPRIGVGNAVFFVLLGQLVAAAAVDHFGWLGAVHYPLNGRRLAGIAVMAVGVWLAKRSV